MSRTNWFTPEPNVISALIPHFTSDEDVEAALPQPPQTSGATHPAVSKRSNPAKSWQYLIYKHMIINNWNSRNLLPTFSIYNWSKAEFWKFTKKEKIRTPKGVSEKHGLTFDQSWFSKKAILGVLIRNGRTLKRTKELLSIRKCPHVQVFTIFTELIDWIQGINKSPSCRTYLHIHESVGSINMFLKISLNTEANELL